MQDVKPLTAAEIAELRRLLKDGELTLSAEAAAALPRLLDEVERTRALLRRIKWGGGKPNENGRCPLCHGLKLGDPVWDIPPGHHPGCELAALLGCEG